MTSVNPASRGQGASGQNLVITGTGFGGANGAFAGTVAFSGTGITVNSKTKNSATQLTVNVTLSQSAATTARNVTVTNPAPVASATCTGCFTVTARPNVMAINPNTKGRGATNQNVNVTGADFQVGATVTIPGGGVTVNSVTRVSSGLLVVNLSVSASATLGGHNVTVANPDGGSGTLTTGFMVTTGPGLTSLSPSSRGQGQSNQNITFNGSNFPSNFVSGGGSVAFSGTGITVNSLTRNSSSTLTVNITVSGSAATGSRNVTVTNPDAGAATLNNGFTVTAAAAPPTLTSLSPSSRGQGASNQNITFNGSNFPSNFVSGGGSVAFSGTGITVNSVTRNSSSTLTVNITVSSSAATGSRNVTVTNPGGASATRNNGFTVNARPTVTSLSPNTKSRGTGAQNITVNGTGFQSGVGVSFSGSGITVISVTRNSSTNLTVRISVSNGASTTFRNVTATNPDGGTFTLNNGFRITN